MDDKKIESRKKELALQAFYLRVKELLMEAQVNNGQSIKT